MHQTGSREEWLAARLELLREEKELTRRSDALAQRRRELPWVRIERDYRFDTEQGSLTLAELFGRRSQLIVYHFMFGPEYTVGCRNCSAIADGFNGITAHLAHHDVQLWAVSRAPLVRLQAYRRRMGWTFPWASSLDTAFNFDYQVSFTEEEQRVQGIEYNYRRGAPLGTTTVANDCTRNDCGVDPATYVRERPGMSAFVKEQGAVYHTYSAYARGIDVLWGAFQWLDRAPLGRKETLAGFQRHDEYAQAV